VGPYDDGVHEWTVSEMEDFRAAFEDVLELPVPPTGVNDEYLAVYRQRVGGLRNCLNNIMALERKASVSRRVEKDQTATASEDREVNRPGEAPALKDDPPGPFDTTIDRNAWKVTRDGKVADFGGKEYPWKVFQLLHDRYPRIAPRADLLNTCWGVGLGSGETLGAHITRVRDLLKPLGLGVKNTRKVGYLLEELSPG
jgi:DNA-binding response OmpR family regulator